MKDLHQAFVASDSTKWEKKKEDILESISCRLLPKKIMDTKEEKNCSDRTKGVLISGVPAKQVKVDEIQYFIDMKIEGMILGVLWIMMIGWQLDCEHQDMTSEPHYSGSAYNFRPCLE